MTAKSDHWRLLSLHEAVALGDWCILAGLVIVTHICFSPISSDADVAPKLICQVQ